MSITVANWVVCIRVAPVAFFCKTAVYINRLMDVMIIDYRVYTVPSLMLYLVISMSFQRNPALCPVLDRIRKCTRAYSTQADLKNQHRCSSNLHWP